MLDELSKFFWQNLIEISPSFFWAGLVLFIGIFVSKWIAALTVAFFNKIKLNQLLKKLGLEEALLKIDTRLNAPKFFSEIVKWFFLILFLMISSEILGLVHFSRFLETIIGYFPNIFISCLIFLVAVFLTDLSQKVVIGTLEKEKIIYSRFFGRVISWIIWLFAILAILYQLKIVPKDIKSPKFKRFMF